GLGATTGIAYAPLTLKNANGFYTPTPASYPLLSLQAPLYVVSQVNAANGIGGVYATNYQYVGGKVDLSGRGFVGFASTVVGDSQTGIVVQTNYSQTFPNTGLPTQRFKWHGSTPWSQTVWDAGKLNETLYAYSWASVTYQDVPRAQLNQTQVD